MMNPFHQSSFGVAVLIVGLDICALEDGDRFFELGQMSHRRSRRAVRVPRKAIDPDALVEEILKLS